jgi:nitrogen-specific signal transduction histidine kinase
LSYRAPTLSTLWGRSSLAATARIFEPFFTIKPAGTGLGLAIARNIARAHHGDLILKINQPGQVCFSLQIPAPGIDDSSGVETRDGQNTGRR